MWGVEKHQRPQPPGIRFLEAVRWQISSSNHVGFSFHLWPFGGGNRNHWHQPITVNIPPSIIYNVYPLRVAWGAGANPRGQWAKGRLHPGQVARVKQPFTLTFTLLVNLESACIWTAGGSWTSLKHTDTGRQHAHSTKKNNRLISKISAASWKCCLSSIWCWADCCFYIKPLPLLLEIRMMRAVETKWWADNEEISKVIA